MGISLKAYLRGCKKTKPALRSVIIMLTDQYRLTTSSLDAQFILRLKNSSGEDMFNESPIERKVTYKFDCIFAKTGDKL